MRIVVVGLMLIGSAALPLSCSAQGGASLPGSGSGSGSGGFIGTSGGGGLAFPGTGGDGQILVPGAGGTQTNSNPDAGTVSGETQEFLNDCVANGNSANFDQATIDALKSGGAPGALRILNPYSGTVFPRGLIAPLLMWDGAAGDAVYVHLHASLFDYQGCLVPTGAGQLQLPQVVWDHAAEHAHGPSDPFTLDVTVRDGGQIHGPVTIPLVIAQASLKGSIFYNSYASKLAGTPFGGSSGAVLRIVPGKPAEEFLETGVCIGCHSVSANGARIVANPSLDFNGGATFAITPGMPPNPPRLAPTAKGTAFAALSPDGTVYLSTAHQGGLGPRNGIGDIFSGQDSVLHETDTGNVISTSGIPTTALTPTFSPDSRHIVFNDFAIDSGHGLAIVDYDKTTRSGSNYRKVYTHTDQASYPAWPFFFPDDGGVVFTVGTEKDFSGANLGINGETGTVSSDVYFLDVATASAKILANAMGYASVDDAASAKTYLPFGADELHHNFYPTVSPVAAGGYFWVFFDSYRHYGNTHGGAPIRQLWGTAVDVSPNGTYTTDPSHPPFYLTGQEDVEGNHRAFTALDPCRADGDSCDTGIDCCVGFCTNRKCEKPPPPVTGPACAKTDESCADGTPCCLTRDKCIAGFCGQIAR